MAKYKLTTNTKPWLGRTLFQIQATVSFGGVFEGDLGGYVENERNLDQDGNARVSGDAWVFENAWVFGNAQVSGNARVFGNAQVSGNARVSGNAWVSGNARVFGNARVSGNARVEKPLIVASRSDGYLFVCFPTKDGPPVITAGCRYFPFSQAREHWTKRRGGTRLGDESLALVDHLERMARLAGWIAEEAAPAKPKPARKRKAA